MYWLQSIVQALNNMGFYGFVLPWLFTFAVIYAILYKANLFGDINKQVSGLLAIVIAFFVTGLGGPFLARFFTTLFGGSAIWLAGILVILIFFELLGLPKQPESNLMKWLVGLVILVLVLVIFLPAAGIYVYGVSLTPDTIAGIFVVVIIALAVYFVLTAKGGEGGEGEKRQ